MAILQQPIRIRLQHNILAIGNAVQYDTYREFHFIFDDYEVPEETTDIRIYIEKPSGRAIYNYGTLVNGEVIFQPTSQTLAEYGTCNGQVQIINKYAILTTFPFKLEVEQSLIDNTDFVSKDEFLVLDELIKTAQSIGSIAQEVYSTEQQRITNENNRIFAENDRIRNENERKSDEEARKNAESSRVTAEQKRESDTSNAIKDCKNAKASVDDIMKVLNLELKSAINDEIKSTITTYSSEKIENLLENNLIVSQFEPEDQHNGGLWLLEE